MEKILFSDNTLRGLLNFRGGVILFFAEKGHVIILVAPPDNLCDLSIFPPNVRHIPVELDRTGANPFRDFRYYNALKDIYRTEKPDYIFHYTIKPNIYGSIAAAHNGISSTAVIPGLGHVYNKDNLVNKVARVMYRFAMNYPDKVLVLNKDNFETFLERKVVKPDKLLLLKGGEGVDLEKYRPAPPPHNKIPVFLMIARLLYEKGYTEYVRAAAALKNEAVFRIMGPIGQHPSAVPESSITDHCRKGLYRVYRILT